MRHPIEASQAASDHVDVTLPWGTPARVHHMASPYRLSAQPAPVGPKLLGEDAATGTPAGSATRLGAVLRRMLYGGAPLALVTALRRVGYMGTQRYCPACESHVRLFTSVGRPPRPDARCPVCGSLERHRLAWLFLQRCTGFLDGWGKSMLHVAPERQLRHRLEPLRNLTYVTADLHDPTVRMHIDITSMPFADDCFDAVFCSHVLEHVADDRAAMRETYRVLKPDGWAVIIVPISSGPTFEDSSISDPTERERVFGQADHVRQYGPDVSDRLRLVGLNVQRFGGPDVVGVRGAIRAGLGRDQLLFCSKQPASAIVRWNPLMQGTMP